MAKSRNVRQQVFRRWQSEMSLTASDCRRIWGILLEQVFWTLLNCQEAVIPLLGVIRIDQRETVGVRIRAAPFLKACRVRILADVNGDGDRDWVHGQLKTLYQPRSRKRGSECQA